MQTIAKRVYGILKSVLEIEVNESTKISRKNCEKWTSLAHIEIIMSVEEEFNIMFLEQDLVSIDSQESLVKRVEELAKNN